MSLAVELVGEFTLAVECMECKKIYKRVPAGRLVKPDEVSSGYCPECFPKIEERWFGKKVTA